MSKQLVNYSGLYKEIKSSAYPLYIRSESIRDRSIVFNWTILPHLHTHLFQLFFIEFGSVKLDRTEGEIILNAPAIIIIPPGNVHGLTYDPEVEGHVITLEYTYVEELLKSSANVLIGLKDLCCLSEFDEKTPFNQLMQIVTQINDEVFSDHKERDFALQSLMSLLYLKLYRLIVRKSLAKSMAGLNESYYHKFHLSFSNTVPFTKSVPEFAAEINISAVHLNRVCQAVAGRPASWLLQEHAVLEAKKLLLYTSYSISEIAYQLNFTDPGYFSRLFKKFTGVAPGLFRKH